MGWDTGRSGVAVFTGGREASVGVDDNFVLARGAAGVVVAAVLPWLARLEAPTRPGLAGERAGGGAGLGTGTGDATGCGSLFACLFFLSSAMRARTSARVGVGRGRFFAAVGFDAGSAAAALKAVLTALRGLDARSAAFCAAFNSASRSLVTEASSCRRVRIVRSHDATWHDTTLGVRGKPGLTFSA